MIPEDYLALTLANVLALHNPRRNYEGASVAQLQAALLALEARLAGPRPTIVPASLPTHRRKST